MADHVGPATVVVELGSRSYEVLVGAGVRDELQRFVPQHARRAAIVTQENIGIEVDSGVEQRMFHIGDGEEHKTMATVEGLARRWSDWGLARNDVVIGVGGGIVTDVAGFAASVYHRGIPVIQVPTSLLGQVDAAIGGKTGVNLPEGKNLVGTFWQPLGVLCDTETLATLPERHHRAGLGELAKYHFLGGSTLDEMDLVDRIAAAVQIKADAVAGDERESGRRALLNYGHTLAHALEIACEHRLLHGEAVAIGLIYAAEVARQLGRIDDARVDHHRRVVAAYDLPMRPPTDIDFADVAPLFGRDKKAVDGATFVLDGPDGLEVVPRVDHESLEVAYERLAR